MMPSKLSGVIFSREKESTRNVSGRQAFLNLRETGSLQKLVYIKIRCT